MSDATYSVVQWPQTRVPLMLEDRFAFRKDVGWHWLQRACFWVLRKLQCNAIENVTHWSQRQFNTRQIGEAILRQSEEVWRFVGHRERRDLCVIMGDEAFRSVVTQADRDAPYGPFALNVAARVGRTGAGGRPFYEMYGYRVVVVPWVAGVHVVPLEYLR